VKQSLHNHKKKDQVESTEEREARKKTETQVHLRAESRDQRPEEHKTTVDAAKALQQLRTKNL